MRYGTFALVAHILFVLEFEGLCNLGIRVLW